MTKRHVDWMKNDNWPKEFFTKNCTFVWINRYIRSLFSKFHSMLTESQISFFGQLLNYTSDWPKKIFNLQLTEGIIDLQFPTFYVPIYPYKTYIFHWYETFLPGTCWKKFPIMYKVLRFHRFPVTKVHNAVWFKSLFSFRQCNVYSSDSPNFHTYLCIQNVPLFCTFLDLQNVPL